MLKVSTEIEHLRPQGIPQRSCTETGSEGGAGGDTRSLLMLIYVVFEVVKKKKKRIFKASNDSKVYFIINKQKCSRKFCKYSSYQILRPVMDWRACYGLERSRKGSSKV